jgi:hypothetical protein
LSEGGPASLAAEKPLIPFNQPPQCFIGGELSAFIGCCHCAIDCWPQDGPAVKVSVLTFYTRCVGGED